MIQRANNKSPFTMIKIDVLRSGLLTLEEIGLYVMMLSRPDNWEFNEFVLSRELGTTQREVHDLLKRLERKGFARERKGRYGTVWDLFELSEQLPMRVTHKDNSVPQNVAKAFVDSIIQQGTNVVQTAVKPEPDCENPMTREEIGQRLIDFAGKLRQNATTQKASASGLPNANGWGIMRV